MVVRKLGSLRYDDSLEEFEECLAKKINSMNDSDELNDESE